MNSPVTFLGIDPGSLKTGFGLVLFEKESLRHLNHGVIFLEDEGSLGARLAALSESLREILLKYRPQHIVVEKIFLGKSPDSAFKLGHARGVAMAEAVRSGAQVFEYATRAVKKSVTGTGGAGKDQVSVAVKTQLKLPRLVNYDASDALALTIHHSYQWMADRKLNSQSMTGGL